MRKIFFVYLLSATFTSVIAQDTLTVELISKYTYDIQHVDGKLSGPGWDSLKQAIAESQFVLLGENHASPELSKLVATMLAEIEPLGFNHFIIETGPISSKKIAELYHKDQSIFGKNIRDFLTTFRLDSDSPPTEFIKMKADVTMYKSAIENSFQLQGIDKEYFSSYRYLFERLEKYCKTENLKTRLRAAQRQLKIYDSLELADKNFKRCTAIKNDAIIKAFMETSACDAEAQQIVNEIKNSLVIYSLYETGHYFESEETRTNLIKKNFGRYYKKQSASKQPFKAFIKYGNMHTGRGENHNGILDIGNAISEFANLNGTKSLHIEGMRRYRYDANGNVIDFLTNGYEVYPNCMAMVSKTEWRVIDLRPLRKLMNNKKLLTGKDETTLIRNNDWVLLTPVDGAYKASLNYE
jgi:hypothetical protein